MNDLGHRVWTLAKALTPEQLDTLLAIAQVSIKVKQRMPILASYGEDECHKPMIEAGMLLWRRTRGFGKDWRVATLTNLGQRVMLCRAEWDLRAAGKIPPERAEDEGEYEP